MKAAQHTVRGVWASAAVLVLAVALVAGCTKDGGATPS